MSFILSVVLNLYFVKTMLDQFIIKNHLNMNKKTCKIIAVKIMQIIVNMEKKHCLLDWLLNRIRADYFIFRTKL